MTKNKGKSLHGCKVVFVTLTLIMLSLSAFAGTESEMGNNQVLTVTYSFDVPYLQARSDLLGLKLDWSLIPHIDFMTIYGGYMKFFPNLINKKTLNTPVDLSKAQYFMDQDSDRIRIYPGSMEIRDSEIFALSSRTVAILGIGDSIEEARKEGIKVGLLRPISLYPFPTEILVPSHCLAVWLEPCFIGSEYQKEEQ